MTSEETVKEKEAFEQYAKSYADTGRFKEMNS
jgi:hypothetical protein